MSETRWVVSQTVDGLAQVWPLGDLRDHDTDHELEDGALTLHCWCRPCLVDGVIVHHSADGREDAEEGRHTCNVASGSS